MTEDRRTRTPRAHWYYYGLTFGHRDVDLVLVVRRIIQASDRVQLHGLVRRQDAFADVHSEFRPSIFNKSSERRRDAARIRQY